jgi:hypothetical protein
MRRPAKWWRTSGSGHQHVTEGVGVALKSRTAALVHGGGGAAAMTDER